MSEAKADTVPGLGFKDKDKAFETIKALEGRDPDYQRLAIKGLIGRAKRVLTLTKDKGKLQNINDAMKIFDDWLKDYEKSNKSKENRSYLPLANIKIFMPLANKYKLNDDKPVTAFLKAYESVKGEYKNLRTVESNKDEPTWDIIRNASLKKIVKRIDDENPDLWDDDLLPSKDHMEMIMWAYSPEATKIKKNLNTYEEKLGKSKESKRKTEETDSSSDEEIPKKKKK